MRPLRVCLLAVAALLISSMPALAVKPVGECPNPKFTAMTYSEFRQLSIDVGVPLELLGPEHLAAFDGFDKNDDGLVCIMDLPDTPGHLGSWVFNAIDNTAAPHR